MSSYKYIYIVRSEVQYEIRKPAKKNKIFKKKSSLERCNRNTFRGFLKKLEKNLKKT